MSEVNQYGPFFRSSRSEPGLRFVCTRCSACCRFDAGYVWLSWSDLDRLRTGLNMSESDVISRYCKVVDISGIRQISLAEQENMDCVFWIDGACSVYQHRPLQCRSFPFWAPYLGSREDWDDLETMCPGVNVGPVHSPDEIESWMAKRRREPPLDADTLSGGADNEG